MTLKATMTAHSTLKKLNALELIDRIGSALPIVRDHDEVTWHVRVQGCLATITATSDCTELTHFNRFLSTAANNLRLVTRRVGEHWQLDVDEIAF